VSLWLLMLPVWHPAELWQCVFVTCQVLPRACGSVPVVEDCLYERQLDRGGRATWLAGCVLRCWLRAAISTTCKAGVLPGARPPALATAVC